MGDDGLIERGLGFQQLKRVDYELTELKIAFWGLRVAEIRHNWVWYVCEVKVGVE